MNKLNEIASLFKTLGNLFEGASTELNNLSNRLDAFECEYYTKLDKDKEFKQELISLIEKNM